MKLCTLFLFSLLILVLIYINSSIILSISCSKSNNNNNNNVCDRSKARSCRILINDLIYNKLPINNNIPINNNNNIPRNKIVKFNNVINYPFPVDCPLNINLDLTANDDTLYRMRSSKNLWRCKKCSLEFDSEANLDKHFDDKHEISISNNTYNNKQSGGICLADYCHIFDCDHRPTETQLNKANEFITPFPEYRCDPDITERNRLECMNLINTCFPLNSDLNILFSRTVCDYHECDKFTGKLIGREKIIQQNMEQNTNKFRYILFILLIIGVLMFYLCVYALSEGPIGFGSSNRSGFQRAYLTTQLIMF